MGDPIEDIIAGIIQREGGYVDHPDDRGGPTKHGIALRTLSHWRGEEMSAEDVRALTYQDAALIYRCLYVEEPGFDRIRSPQLAAQVIDAGVLHGPGRATVWLQKAVETRADGIIGPKTRAAIDAMPVDRAVRRFGAEQVRFMGTIISADTSQAVFAAGWLARAAEHLEGP